MWGTNNTEPSIAFRLFAEWGSCGRSICRHAHLAESNSIGRGQRRRTLNNLFEGKPCQEHLEATLLVARPCRGGTAALRCCKEGNKGSTSQHCNAQQIATPSIIMWSTTTDNTEHLDTRADSSIFGMRTMASRFERNTPLPASSQQSMLVARHMPGSCPPPDQHVRTCIQTHPVAHPPNANA
eukprot:2406854-Amphidinium_carterae.2